MDITRSIREWAGRKCCKEKGLTRAIITARKNRGWSDKDTLSLPRDDTMSKILEHRQALREKHHRPEKPVVYCTLSEQQWRAGMQRMNSFLKVLENNA